MMKSNKDPFEETGVIKSSKEDIFIEELNLRARVKTLTRFLGGVDIVNSLLEKDNGNPDWKKPITVPIQVGDVNGTDRGSGARFNAGKPPLDLIPFSILASTAKKSEVKSILLKMDLFQFSGDVKHLRDMFDSKFTLYDIIGKKKRKVK